MDKDFDQVIAGQATYTPFFLNIYDLFVIKFSNKFFWRCPPSKTVDLYNRCLTDNHLEIGVGTGYYLKASSTDKTCAKIDLMDLNPNSLKKTQGELEGIGVSSIKVFNHNALEAFPFQNAEYSSVGLNYLLHCVPGNLEKKLGLLFNNIERSFAPGKNIKVFGSTIVTDNESHTTLSKNVMSFYHRKGIFHNQEDTFSQLSAICEKYSDEISLKIIGAVAFFEVNLKT